ncbi:hypothetical protein [Treponema sp.]|uniref:hypothetical protein n=1 Tax=Treponema sp. TaxID=166 RepID=UPI00388F9E09
MRRIFLFFVFSMFSLAVFAKSWTNNVGVGTTISFSKIGVDETNADDINQLGLGIEGFYLGCHENGFTAKIDYALGAALTKDINLQGTNTNTGFFTNIALGGGYSIYPTETFLISFTLMAGMDISVFTDEKTGYTYTNSSGEQVDADYDRSISLDTINVGPDIFVRYKAGEHFGFFVNLSARYIIAGLGKDETNYTWEGTKNKEYTEQDKSDFDLFGYFRIQPTIGVSWTF